MNSHCCIEQMVLLRKSFKWDIQKLIFSLLLLLCSENFTSANRADPGLVSSFLGERRKVREVAENMKQQLGHILRDTVSLGLFRSLYLLFWGFF